ncbi:polyamine ABC transporter substrate-binding protein [Camelimonas abortus]|uniref:Putrescine-binding periplasmic protein n=1 Tax=Camelimonas abortus TaxID=1017184 RepID=A0ABV7LGU6_9HYPH
MSQPRFFRLSGVTRRFAAALALGAVAACFAAPFSGLPAAAGERVVHIYNWSDYIDPAMLKKFTEETGIAVVYDTYDSNEIVESKLMAGKSGYDVVAPTGPALQRLIRAGVLRELDREKLPNLKHVWPEVAGRLAVYDPGNRYAVNYMWGTTGIGVNTQKVKQALGPDAQLDSLALLLDPQKARKLAACGVMVLDSAEDVLPATLRYLGRNPDSKDPADLQAAAEALGKVRGDIRKLHSSEYIAALANGDVCMVFGFSGDILQARQRAKEAGTGVDIAYILPREGAQMWFDNFVIPADAPHPEEAHAFINFMLRPDVAAANSNFIAYASGVGDARPMVKPELLNDPGVYPDSATMARLFTTISPDERAQRAITRLWTRFRSGR